DVISTKIVSANKGGLMVEVNNVPGFLPVSQLSIEHYPRVEEGDKNRILGILNSYVGQNFSVQVITADAEEEKLIVSEKAVHEEELQQSLSSLKIGETVTGQITGIVDFGVFVKFGELEGLVHISELAWQRIENPKDLFKVGDTVQAKIIAIEKGRVSLSIKQLQNDPWQEAVKKYQLGQVVKGKVAKIMPFGVFVELDEDIQGLAHLGELAHEEVKDATTIVKEGEDREFKVISIEPAEHRLGLSIKQLTEAPKKAAKAEKAEVAEEKVEETPAEEASAPETEEAKAE
ncbi:MAG TPA: S1 RNA-binding domain-containing protein, partial [Candidatus Doudnabacteria bacterium]|nr:S1 RNA-binding domain-containing protein [Candidatus Doudnabacteria bacterium]